MRETGRIFAVYYSERLHVEAAVHAGQLIRDGAIGRVMQVIGLGPHRLGAAGRPEWFWHKEQYGGILVDIGSHQIEQFLYYADAQTAEVLGSTVANYHNPEHPEFEDFGDASLVAAQWDELLLPRRLVYSQRPRGLGRRPHDHLGDGRHH